MRDASIVDIAWGPAFLVIAVVSYWIGDGAPARSNLLLALVALWSLRLAGLPRLAQPRLRRGLPLPEDAGLLGRSGSGG